MPEMLAKKAEAKATKTRQLLERDPKEVMLTNLQAQEKKAMAKMERIKSWPREHQAVALARTEDTLNQIRERMSQLEPSAK
jgi:hypothetical protein